MASHGFTGIIEETGFSIPLPMTAKRAAEPGAIPRHLRLAFEELGPTFVKLGQLFSTRPDIFPDVYIEEFSKLTDDTPEFEFSEVLKILKEEFGRDPYEIFSRIEEKPIAAASIAQVHKAWLDETSEPVVLKVQRPGITKTVQNDIQVLYFIAQALERVREDFESFNLKGIIQEFQRTINNELDFHLEAQNTELFREKFKDMPGIVIPEVFWELSTKRVLTLRFIPGTRFSKLRTFPAEVDRTYLLEQLVQFMLEGMLFQGIFHADIHAGNIILMPGEPGKLGIIDFGLVGNLHDDLKLKISKLFVAFVSRDYHSLAVIYADIGEFFSGLNIKEFQKDIADFLEPRLRGDLSDIDTGKMLYDSTKIARRHRIRLPRDLVLFFRSLITLENIGRRLDPHFDFMSYGARFSKLVIRKRFAPDILIKDLMRTVDGLRSLGVELPTFIRALNRQIESNASERHQKRMERNIQTVRRSIRQVGISLLCFGALLSASLLSGLSPHHFLVWPLWIIGGGLGFLWVVNYFRS